MDFEKIFIAQLMNKQYKTFIKTVLPFIQLQYFSNNVYRSIVKYILAYIKQYKKVPPVYIIQNQIFESITNEIDKQLAENFFNEVPKIHSSDIEEQWLIDEAEKFLKEKSLYNAILSAIDDIETKKIEIKPDVINNLQKALGFSFDKSVGLELTSKIDAEKRFDAYQTKIEHYSTGIPKLDLITNGGYEKKTLSIYLAPTGVGKTNYLVFTGAELLRQGLNVLYITLEMSEEKIAQRFDANFLQVPINDISKMNKTEYLNLIEKKLLNLQNRGRLIIKEYPPVSISTMNIITLLDELKLKENFIPDVLILDYLGLMKSDRFIKSENSYIMGKSISEEIRGLAIEQNLAVISAVQTNRQGSKLSNIEMDSISESFGIVFTADFVASLIMTPEMREQKIQVIRVLKNRFGDIVNYSIPVKVYFDRATIQPVEDDVTAQSYTSLNEHSTEKLVQQKQKTNQTMTVEVNVDDLDDLDDF